MASRSGSESYRLLRPTHVLSGKGRSPDSYVVSVTCINSLFTEKKHQPRGDVLREVLFLSGVCVCVRVCVERVTERMNEARQAQFPMKSVSVQ